MATYDTTALDSALEFDVNFAESKSVVQVTGTDRVIMFWLYTTAKPMVQTFDVNTSTGELTAVGTALDLGGAGDTGSGVSICLIDASNALASWNGAGDDGWSQLIAIDASGNCTANGSAVEWDAVQGHFCNTVLMDATHILNVWDGNSDGFAQILTVVVGDGTDGTITAEGSVFSYDSDQGERGSIAKLSDTKVAVFYGGVDDDLYAGVLSINTSTWAVTAAGTFGELVDAVTIEGTSLTAMDTTSNPMTMIGAWGLGATNATNIAAFNISTSTWAITTLGSTVEVSAASTWEANPVRVAYVDDTHALVAWCELSTPLVAAEVYTFDSSTGVGAVTANTVTISSATGTGEGFSTMCPFTGIDGGYVLGWQGGGGDGFMQTLQVEMPADPYSSSVNFLGMMN